MRVATDKTCMKRNLEYHPTASAPWQFRVCRVLLWEISGNLKFNFHMYKETLYLHL